jgi:transposase InsO family protein
MPWQELSRMSLRSEFIALATQPDANVSQVCRRFGISRKTAYKWLGRSQPGAAETLADRSRRPHHSPRTTDAAMTAAVLAVRQEHPVWGGRKIGAVLRERGLTGVPSASTITAILRRAALLDPAAAAQHRPVVRFTQPAPNLLWQMDFKGHIPTVQQGRCHPLTVLDDHSRFNLGLIACADERTATVRTQLTQLFRCYGLPERILCDNGAPWGTAGSGVVHSPSSASGC